MPDTFLYFAYGSNMLTGRLTARTHSATSLCVAIAEGEIQAGVHPMGETRKIGTSYHSL